MIIAKLSEIELDLWDEQMIASMYLDTEQSEQLKFSAAIQSKIEAGLNFLNSLPAQISREICLTVLLGYVTN